MTLESDTAMAHESIYTAISLEAKRLGEAIDIPKLGVRIYPLGADGIPVVGPIPADAKEFHAAFGDVEDDTER